MTSSAERAQSTLNADLDSIDRAQAQQQQRANEAKAAATSFSARAAAAAAAAAGARKPSAGEDWRETTWVGRALGWVSNWLLTAILVMLLCYARHMIDPLSHLVGYQVILKDISIIDGDTFRAKVYPEMTEGKFKLRLVDAPELAQPYGRSAAEVLLETLLGRGAGGSVTDATWGSGPGGAIDSFFSAEHSDREVIASIIGREETGGYYADVLVRDSVYLNTTSVAHEMVLRGAAWAHRGFHSPQRPSSLVVAMEEAQAAKRGLWGMADKPEEPWEFVDKMKGKKKQREKDEEEMLKKKKQQKMNKKF